MSAIMAKPRLSVVPLEPPRDELGAELDKLALAVVKNAQNKGDEAPTFSQKTNALKIASGYWALRRANGKEPPGSAFEQYRREMAAASGDEE